MLQHMHLLLRLLLLLAQTALALPSKEESFITGDGLARWDYPLGDERPTLLNPATPQEALAMVRAQWEREAATVALTTEQKEDAEFYLACMDLVLQHAKPQDAYKMCHNWLLNRRSAKVPPGLDLLMHMHFGRPRWEDPDPTEGLADDDQPAFIRLQAAASERLGKLRAAATYMRSPRFAQDVRRQLAARVGGDVMLGSGGGGRPKRTGPFLWPAVGRLH